MVRPSFTLSLLLQRAYFHNKRKLKEVRLIRTLRQADDMMARYSLSASLLLLPRFYSRLINPLLLEDTSVVCDVERYGSSDGDGDGAGGGAGMFSLVNRGNNSSRVANSYTAVATTIAAFFTSSSSMRS